ncbi:MAG: PDZ domain-containing protein [Pseudomonadaceae bacterium]|nr:PDZ domain-containing protein [Pseudomonadaceae bacterium]
MRVLAIIVACLAIGFIAGTLYGQSSPTPDAATSGIDLSADVNALKASDAIGDGLASVLQGLIDGQAESASELAEVSASVEEIREALANMAVEQREQDVQLEGEVSAGTTARPRGVDPQALIEAGFTASQADDIVRLADEATYARLQLRYEALREGWNPGQLREAAASLPSIRDSLTQDYGEDAFDRYLYATGQPNRVVVRSTLQGSPAEIAGIRNGDTLYAVDDTRVYANSDLLRIAASGDAGEQIPVTVLRDGERLNLYVPRGPLGLTSRRGFSDPDQE